MFDAPVAFLATTDAERCKAFYTEVLGLELIEDGAWAIVFDLCGVELRVQKVERVLAAPYTALGVRVDRLAESMDALRARGVEFLLFDGLEQDDHGVWTTPGGAKVAWFRDPDGHVLSIASPP